MKNKILEILGLKSNFGNIKKILLAAFFLATAIVLDRFAAIRTPILTISFVFVPYMLCGMMLGPVYTILVCTLTDVIGAFAFPTGPYYFGFTVTMVLVGAIYGFVLYKGRRKMSFKEFAIRAVIAITLVLFICHFLLNSTWLYLMMGDAGKWFRWIRLGYQFIMLPIQIVLILALDRLLEINRVLKVDGGDDETEEEKLADSEPPAEEPSKELVEPTSETAKVEEPAAEVKAPKKTKTKKERKPE